MRMIISGGILLLLFACAASTVSKTKPLLRDYVANAPQMRVGDRWKINLRSINKIIERQVVKVNDDGSFTLRVTDDNYAATEIEYDKNYNILNEQNTPTKATGWDTGNYIRFPLFVGKTYRTSFKKFTPMRGRYYDYNYTFTVSDVSEVKFTTHNIHVFTVKFSFYRNEDPWSGTGKLLYSPELKSIIKLIPGWGMNSDVIAYRVAADKILQVGQGGILQPIAGAADTADNLLTFGYENLTDDSAEIAVERARMKEELRRLAREQELAAQTRRENELQASAELSRKLAEVEKLSAAKLAAAKLEAERLAQETLAVAAAQAEQRAEQLAEQKLQEARLAAENAARINAQQRVEENNQYGIAVVIGNRDYATNNADVPNVSYAHNDADAMYTYLKDTLGFQEGNIILLKDASQAELSSVFGNERSYKGKLYNWTQADQSRIFVYYSGHGAPGLADGTSYLLPVDADPMTVELNGYPLETLYANLSKIPAKEITVVIDACFSGASASGNLVKSASSIALRRVESKSVLRNGTILSAADVSEVASWDDERKMGLFTAQFLDGVQGAADSGTFGNGDGKVNLGELKKYLQTKVSYLARRNFYRDQHPQIIGDDGKIVGAVNTF